LAIADKASEEDEPPERSAPFSWLFSSNSRLRVSSMEDVEEEIDEEVKSSVPSLLLLKNLGEEVADRRKVRGKCVAIVFSRR
jgi:hypothetical protein